MKETNSILNSIFEGIKHEIAPITLEEVYIESICILLKRNGITTFEELCKLSHDDLIKIDGLGEIDDRYLFGIEAEMRYYNNNPQSYYSQIKLIRSKQDS